MLQHGLVWRRLAYIVALIGSWNATGTGTVLADYPEPAPQGRYVYAPIVAIEQPIFYNRFGSFDPYGTMYALRRDVVDQSSQPLGRQPVDANGRPVFDDELAGKVNLHIARRPRPLILRGNVGDILIVDLQNLLPKLQPDLRRCRDSATYRKLQLTGPDGRCSWNPSGNNDHTHYDELRAEIEPFEWPDEPTERGRRRIEDQDEREARQDGEPPNGDWPLTRTVSLAVPGIEVVRCDGTDAAPDDLATGLQAIPPGGSQRYCFRLNREGTFIFSSLGAPAGGEGDGGSLTHGLFGAINVEPRGSKIYRSQVSQAVLEEAKSQAEDSNAFINYEAVVAKGRKNYDILFSQGLPDGTPLLAMYDEKVKEDGDKEEQSIRLPGTNQEVLELVHGDLTAIIDRCPDVSRGTLDQGTCAYRDAPAIREYTIVFHDELKTFYPDELKELESEESAFGSLAGKPLELGGGFNPLAGVRDGFAINYGSSGMGSILLANRKAFGPTKDCVDCAYEEFFLGSWANGDPALLKDYVDDPSNVYHSYLGDPVVFRNTHAGPKETHVFHLHAHQWLAQQAEPGAPAPDGLKREYGTYLDSQTIAPMQGFSYEIYHGGSGNLNLAPGDSIFHCHLYPHFAQGMWSLWRVHDVFEDGSLERRLPDAEYGTTPNPAIVPLPGKALAPMPDENGFQGYPFYIAGEKGRRAPQAPNDVVESGGLPRHLVAEGTRTFSNVTNEVRKDRAMELNVANSSSGRLQFGRELLRHALVTGDFSNELEKARIEVLPAEGTSAEKLAMSFHAAGLTGLKDPTGNSMDQVKLPDLPDPDGDPAFGQLQRDDPVKIARLRQAGYESRMPDGRDRLADGSKVVFRVNGSTNKPGAPFADPCRDVPQRTRGAGALVVDMEDLDGDGNTTELLPEDIWINRPRLTHYDVSAIETTLVANTKGWHDPQGHINVLSAEVQSGAPAAAGYAQATDAKPFFFRAHSGDCIEFHHTNRLRKELDLDDFQVRTPTDTIGQHIHLVKFDVTASDGSGNGWNYEDGTFAKEALVERLMAAYRWRATGGTLSPDTTAAVDTACRAGAKPGEPICDQVDFQTTVQRWYADPILTWAEDSKGKEVKADRTLRTVFTHDHFGPSSIQQHGFYSALLVEPRGSKWLKGLVTSPTSGVNPSTALLPGKAVGTQALIQLPDTFLDFGYLTCRTRPSDKSPDWNAWQSACLRFNPDIVLHGDPRRTGPMARTFREFALAVADFALLYDPCRSGNVGEGACEDIVGPEHADHGLPGVQADLAKLPLGHAPERGFPYLDRPNGAGKTPRQEAEDRVVKVEAHGRPVAPPKRPEAISKDHHDPYLFNYRNEPIPLRIARPGSGGWEVKPGPQGDLANLFDSEVHGREPATELFQALEDERIQVRLIQGAQEVQHMISLHDLSWRREAGDRQSPFVGAQEIGISEHFEIGVEKMPLVPATTDKSFVDRLYADGTVDALWNGAWGLIRTYTSDSAIYQEPPAEELLANTVVPGATAKTASPKLAAAQALDRKLGPTVRDVLNRAAVEAGLPLLQLKTPQSDARGSTVEASDSQAFIATNQELLRKADTLDVAPPPAAANADAGDDHVTCPASGPAVRFTIEAWPVGTWLNNGDGAVRAAAANGMLHDPAGLTYRLLHTARSNKLSKLDMPDRLRLREAARREDQRRGYVPPMVLRANAGECIVVELTNCLRGTGPDGRSCQTVGTVADDQPSDANPDGFPGQPEKGLLPRIVPFNAQNLVPSRYVDIRPQLVGWDVTTADGVRTGRNERFRGLIGPGTTDDRFVWYAGLVTATRCSKTAVGQNAAGEPFLECKAGNLGKRYTVFKPVPFGAVPLSSFADVVEHGSQGLVGTLVVEPASARHTDPATGDRLDVGKFGGQVAKATLDNGGQEALIHWREPTGIWAPPRHEFVLVYQDGLSSRWRPWQLGAADVLVPDCRVCDDSYDLGERGVAARSEPFWYRLGLNPGDGDDRGRGHNLNRFLFRPDFLASAFWGRPPATPGLRAKDGEVLTIRVVHPSGRARQRAFVLYGHDYPDILPRYGSAGSALVAPGRTVNAHICDFWMEPRRTDYGYETRYCAAGGAHAGRWLWRDGPAPHFASGAWGTLTVE